MAVMGASLEIACNGVVGAALQQGMAAEKAASPRDVGITIG
jgi:hypothetical protein